MCIMFSLQFRIIGIVALSTDDGVSNGNGACHGEGLIRRVDYIRTDLHHGDVTAIGKSAKSMVSSP